MGMFKRVHKEKGKMDIGNSNLGVLNDIEPQELERKISEQGALVLECNTELLKLYNNTKITEDEAKLLGEAISKDWAENILTPYLASVHGFCKKYDIFPACQTIQSYRPEDFASFVMSKKIIGATIERFD